MFPAPRTRRRLARRPRRGMPEPVNVAPRPGGVDDAELSLLAVVVVGGQPLDDLVRRAPAPQQVEPVRAVARIRVRLRRDRTDLRCRPGHDRAHGEEFRLGDDAPLAGVRDRTAQIEYVATTGRLAIGEIGQVDGEERLVGNEHAGDLRAGECRRDRPDVVRVDDDGHAVGVSCAQRLDVLDTRRARAPPSRRRCRRARAPAPSGPSPRTSAPGRSQRDRLAGGRCDELDARRAGGREAPRAFRSGAGRSRSGWE